MIIREFKDWILRKHVSSESEFSLNWDFDLCCHTKAAEAANQTHGIGTNLLIIDDAGPDLGSLVPGCALDPQRSLVEGLARDAVVGQLDVDGLLQLQRPHQDVVGLEVTEDDVLPVQIRQACHDLIGHFEGEHVTQRHVLRTWGASANKDRRQLHAVSHTNTSYDVRRDCFYDMFMTRGE